VYFGFSGDVHAAPDLRKLETLLQESFTELSQGVGLRPPKQKQEKKKKVLQERQERQVASTVAAPAVFQVMSGASESEPKRAPEPAPTNERQTVLPQLVVA
jgi:hypothetical protein